MNSTGWVTGGASIIGREHVRLGKNNQDGWAQASVGDTSAVVVTDGCSSARSSEVGAQLAAKWLAAHVVGVGAPLDEAFALRAVDALTSWVYRVVTVVEPRPEAFSQATQESFLFTFLCAVARGRTVLVFGIGDGVVAVDGRVVRLDAGPENAPDYVGYRLLGASRPSVRVHHCGAAERVLIATDGLERAEAAMLERFSAEPGLATNAYALQRRLNVAEKTERFLDDATMGVLRQGGA